MTIRDRLMLIRADASARIGSGHVTRCLNLASAWKAEGGEVTLCAAEITPALADRALADGVTLERIACERGGETDAQITRGLACSASAVVVDGYEFDRAFQAQLSSGSATVLAIDDEPGARGFTGRTSPPANPATAAKTW